ncbi:unnamed protein product [Aphanomyces euteiches]
MPKKRQGRKEPKAENAKENDNEIPESTKFDASFVIGQGRHDVITIWREMTKEDKTVLLALDEEDIIHARRRFQQRFPQYEIPPISMNSEEVSSIQALFLHAMETKQGQIAPHEQLSIEAAMMVFYLEERLLFSIVRRDINRKSSIVLLYFIWTSSWPWLGLSVALFITFSSMTTCQLIRDGFCSTIQWFLIQHEDPFHVEWHAHSYITALLLLLLSTGSNMSVYITIGVLLVIPHIVFALKSKMFAQGAADQAALDRIMSAMSLINKIILVFYCWDSYSSLFMVVALFFVDIVLALLTLSFQISAELLYVCRIFIVRMIPQALWSRYEAWIESNRYGALVIGLFPSIFGALVVYYTWDWSFPFGLIVRWSSFILVTQLTPSGLIAIAFQLILLIIGLPLYAIRRLSGSKEPNPTT